MSDPYRIDPKAFDQHRRAVQEERTVTLQDDSVRTPPSVGPEPALGIILGHAAAGQPLAEDARPRPSWGQRLLRILLWTAVGLLALDLLRMIFRSI